MPVKIARSTPRPSFGLPELLVAIHTSRQSCCKAGKARIFALVWESSGESRFSRFRRLIIAASTDQSRAMLVPRLPSRLTSKLPLHDHITNQ
jgi:hypothetical protein